MPRADDPCCSGLPACMHAPTRNGASIHVLVPSRLLPAVLHTATLRFVYPGSAPAECLMRVQKTAAGAVFQTAETGPVNR
jgi:hypothetical protein